MTPHYHFDIIVSLKFKNLDLFIMRSFFKYFFAVILGGIVSAIVLMLLVTATMAAFVAMASSDQQETIVQSKSVLKVDINGEVIDRVQDSPLSELFGAMNHEPGKNGLNKILSNIKKAKRDTNIVGIYLQCGNIQTGYATIEEIRNALIDFKKSGKFVVSYSEIYSQKGYYLATAADSLYLFKEGYLQFQGLNMENLYFKNMFEKIGIEWVAFKHGKFKSGVESFSSDKMSDEDRLQRKELLEGIWSHLTERIADSRGLTKAEVNNFVNSNTFMSDNKLLVSSQLIDGLKYEDEVLELLKKLSKTATEDKTNSVSLKKYDSAFVPEEIKELTMDKIAIIYAEGGIDMSKSDGIQSKELAKTIREAREDENIKAIVLRVNSPGGSAMGSDIIWRELLLAKKAKPLIVSMGDLAASGGYYISCVADTIFAQKSTITGSIGIYAQIPNFKSLREKVGVNVDGVSTNKNSDFLNGLSFLTRPWNESEKAMIQAYIERGYKSFVSKVTDGRDMTFDQVDAIAQGRIWTGVAANDIKLVDGFGGIDDAVEAAKNRAKLKNFRLVELPEQLSPMEQFMKDLGGEARALVSVELFGINSKDIDLLNNVTSQDVLQAKMPYLIDIR